MKMRENSVRRVEEKGGKHRTGRGTDTLLSTVIEIVCTDPLYMWILHTLMNLYQALSIYILSPQGDNVSQV